MRKRGWLWPLLGVLAGVALAFVFLAVDAYLASTGTTGAPEAALTVLVVVLAGSAVLVALLAVVGARRTQLVPALPAHVPTATLAVLLAAMSLAIVATGAVRLGNAGETPFGPASAVTVAALLFVLGLVMFGRHASALGSAAHPYLAVARLGDLAVAAADRAYPAVVPPDVPSAPQLQLGRVIPAERSGYVVAVDTAALAAAASKANVVIEAPAIGQFLTRGEPLLHVHALDGGKVPGRIARGVRVADVRDPCTDVAFALGLLSDVAVRSIHDEPGVAEAAIDRIGEVLGRLGPRPFPTGRTTGARGALRVVQPVVGWQRLVDVALSDIAVRGAADPRVRDRLNALVEQLSRRVAPERAAALRPYASHRGWPQAAERRVPVYDMEHQQR